MSKYNKAVLTFLLFTQIMFAQSKLELEEQKKEIQEQINFTSNLLKTIGKDKKKSLSYLKILNKQIEQKEQYVVSLNAVISQLNKDLNLAKQDTIELNNKIKLKEIDLEKSRSDYAKMIYAAFKYSHHSNKILFIVSSENINQAYKRILYLKQFALYRKKQSNKIEKFKLDLKSQKSELIILTNKLKDQFVEKQKLLTTQKKELESISIDKQQKNNVLESLTKSELKIKKKLQVQKKKIDELNTRIKQIIEEEIAKASKKSSEYKSTPEILALSQEFSKNKGSLPWPVEKGIIISRYGVQKHPIFNNVKTYNNGINIATKPGSIVRSVFEGVVSRIFFIKGKGKGILINHGEYFTVYSGIQEVSVKSGDKIFSKQMLGTVLTNEEENQTEIHFEIWKGYEKKDPSDWLYKAY